MKTSFFRGLCGKRVEFEWLWHPFALALHSFAERQVSEIMKKYTVSGVARFVNGMLAILIFYPVITFGFLVFQHGAVFIPFLIPSVVLFVGVIRCEPRTYIVIAILSLVGFSLALRDEAVSRLP